MAALGLGCAREPECIPWQDVEITRSGPDVTEADVAAVQEEVAQMAEWTGLEEVCLQRVQVVGPEHAERLFEHTDWIGRFNPWDGGKAYVSTGPKLRRTTRHELCHAVDATLGWPSMERESPLLEGAFNDDNRCDAAERFAVICEEGPGRATFRGLVEEACPTVELGQNWGGVEDGQVEQEAFVEATAFPASAAVWDLGVIPTTSEQTSHEIAMDWPVGLDREGEVDLLTRVLTINPDRLVVSLKTYVPDRMGGGSVRLLDIPRSGDAPSLSGPLETAGYRAEKRDTWFWLYSGFQYDGELLLQSGTIGRKVRRIDAGRLEPVEDLPAVRGVVYGPWSSPGPPLVAEVGWATARPAYIHTVRTLEAESQVLWESSLPLSEEAAHTLVPGREDGPWLVSARDFHGGEYSERGDLWLTPLGDTNARARLIPGPRLEPGGYHPRMATTRSGVLLFLGHLWPGSSDSAAALLAYDPDTHSSGIVEGWCGDRDDLHWSEIIAGDGVLGRATVRDPTQDGFVLDVTWTEPDL